MKHDLAPEISQLCVANLANSPTIGCAPQEVPLGYDWHLDLKNFRHNFVVPELIKGSLGNYYKFYFIVDYYTRGYWIFVA